MGPTPYGPWITRGMSLAAEATRSLCAPELPSGAHAADLPATCVSSAWRGRGSWDGASGQAPIKGELPPVLQFLRRYVLGPVIWAQVPTLRPASASLS